LACQEVRMAVAGSMVVEFCGYKIENKSVLTRVVRGNSYEPAEIRMLSEPLV